MPHPAALSLAHPSAPRPPTRRAWLAAALAGTAAAATGCATRSGATAQEDAALAASAWARATRIDGTPPTTEWLHKRYGNQRPTTYRPVQHQGRVAIHAVSDAGNSTLRLPLPAPLMAQRLRFSWWVPALNDMADLNNRDADDAVVRIILTFDGPRDRFTRRDRMLSELAHLVTGEPLPYATLMYVWDNRYTVDTVVDNPHTQRIRKLVIQTGPQSLRRWVEHDRDVRGDFQRTFGEAPGPLTGMGLMSDANNTRQKVSAWFGPLALSTRSAGSPAG